MTGEGPSSALAAASGVTSSAAPATTLAVFFGFSFFGFFLCLRDTGRLRLPRLPRMNVFQSSRMQLACNEQQEERATSQSLRWVINTVQPAGFAAQGIQQLNFSSDTDVVTSQTLPGE